MAVYIEHKLINGVTIKANIDIGFYASNEYTSKERFKVARCRLSARFQIWLKKSFAIDDYTSLAMFIALDNDELVTYGYGIEKGRQIALKGFEEVESLRGFSEAEYELIPDFSDGGKWCRKNPPAKMCFDVITIENDTPINKNNK